MISIWKTLFPTKKTEPTETSKYRIYRVVGTKQRFYAIEESTTRWGQQEKDWHWLETKCSLRQARKFVNDRLYPKKVVYEYHP